MWTEHFPEFLSGDFSKAQKCAVNCVLGLYMKMPSVVSDGTCLIQTGFIPMTCPSQCCCVLGKHRLFGSNDSEKCHCLHLSSASYASGLCSACLFLLRTCPNPTNLKLDEVRSGTQGNLGENHPRNSCEDKDGIKNDDPQAIQ